MKKLTVFSITFIGFFTLTGMLNANASSVTVTVSITNKLIGNTITLDTPIDEDTKYIKTTSDCIHTNSATNSEEIRTTLLSPTVVGYDNEGNPGYTFDSCTVTLTAEHLKSQGTKKIFNFTSSDGESGSFQIGIDKQGSGCTNTLAHPTNRKYKWAVEDASGFISEDDITGGTDWGKCHKAVTDAAFSAELK